MNILKIFTYAGCSQDYWDHIMTYPSNEDSVAVKGYGVDDSNPENAERQFKATAEYYGNERKNHLNQYIGMTDVGSISDVALLLGFVQILFRAIDIPFTYRFGSKKGSLIKLICTVILAIFLSVILILNADNMDNITDIGKKVFNVQNSSLILSVCLVVCLALYYLSYRITCRLYLKGVEQYDH